MEERKMLTALPARTSLTGSSFLWRRLISPYTRSRAAPAPRKEHITIPEKLIPGKKARHTARAKEDPALIPRSPESARGFRVIPCMIAPAQANAAPTMIQPMVLGTEAQEWQSAQNRTSPAAKSPAGSFPRIYLYFQTLQNKPQPQKGLRFQQ